MAPVERKKMCASPCASLLKSVILGIFPSIWIRIMTTGTSLLSPLSSGFFGAGFDPKENHTT